MRGRENESSHLDTDMDRVPSLIVDASLNYAIVPMFIRPDSHPCNWTVLICK